MATSMDTVPAHLLPLAMEEFPQSLATACVCRAGQREPRLRCVQCGIIEEEEEEDYSTLEQEQAQRSFLQTLENLRRSTRWTSVAKRFAWCLRPIWLACNILESNRKWILWVVIRSNFLCWIRTDYSRQQMRLMSPDINRLLKRATENAYAAFGIFQNNIGCCIVKFCEPILSS